MESWDDIKIVAWWLKRLVTFVSWSMIFIAPPEVDYEIIFLKFVQKPYYLIDSGSIFNS